MKLNDHLLYWVIPLCILLPLLIMYFSEVPWAVEIVCPSVNWELGVVENIQLLLLLLIFFISLQGVRKKEIKYEKIVFVFIAVFTLWVFLEEIDYGLHFLKYFKGHTNTAFRQITGKTNIHGLGNNPKLFKRSIYPLMGTLFIIAPLLKNQAKHFLLKYLIPKKAIIITAIITILSYLVPRFLVDFNIFKDGGLGVNIGEFSEIIVYYIFFIYLYEIIYKKRLSIA